MSRHPRCLISLLCLLTFQSSSTLWSCGDWWIQQKGLMMYSLYIYRRTDWQDLYILSDSWTGWIAIAEEWGISVGTIGIRSIICWMITGRCWLLTISLDLWRIWAITTPRSRRDRIIGGNVWSWDTMGYSPLFFVIDTYHKQLSPYLTIDSHSSWRSYPCILEQVMLLLRLWPRRGSGARGLWSGSPPLRYLP